MYDDTDPKSKNAINLVWLYSSEKLSMISICDTLHHFKDGAN